MDRYSTFIDGKDNTIKKSVLPNFIYRVNAIPIKILANDFVDVSTN